MKPILILQITIAWLLAIGASYAFALAGEPQSVWLWHTLGVL